MHLLVQLVLCVALLLGLTTARYHDKTRFDRSINYGHHAPRIVDQKPRIFTDPESHYTAYKDAALSICYLEKTRNNELDDSKLWRDVVQNNRKTLHTSTHYLTKIEAWRLAGGRIVDFCKGMKMVPLIERKPVIIEQDPFFNELPGDENDVFEKRISDVVLNPLKVRARRHAILEEQHKHLQADQQRKKREARGNYRGQTQSQYMNFDGKNEGKAEAEATRHSSHAIVGGSSGMGQAQSMSSGSDGCEDCYRLPGSIQSSMLGPNRGVASGGQPGTYPSGSIPGANTALNPGTIVYPGFTPGTVTTGSGGTNYPNGGVSGSNIPSTGSQVGRIIPGSQTTPGHSIPSTQQSGAGPNVQVPGGSYPSGTLPGTQGSSSSGSDMRGVGKYPGTQTGNYYPHTPSGPQVPQPGTYLQSPIPGGQTTVGQSSGPANQIPSGTSIPSPQMQPQPAVPGSQVGGVQGILGPGGVMYYPSQPQWPVGYPSGPQIAGSTPQTQSRGAVVSGGTVYPQITGSVPLPQGSPQYPQNTQTLPNSGSQISQGTYPPGIPSLGLPTNQINGGLQPATQSGIGVSGTQGSGTYLQPGFPYIPGTPSGGATQGSGAYFPNGQYGGGSVPGSSPYVPGIQTGQGFPGVGVPSRPGEYTPQLTPGSPSGTFQPQNPNGITYPPPGTFPGVIGPGQPNTGYIPSLGQGGVGQQPGLNLMPGRGIPGVLTPGSTTAPGSQPTQPYGTNFPSPQIPGINTPETGVQPGGAGVTTYPNINPSQVPGTGTTGTGMQSGSTGGASKPVARGDIPGTSTYPGTQTGGNSGPYPPPPPNQVTQSGGASSFPGSNVVPGQYPGSLQYPSGGSSLIPGQGSTPGIIPGTAGNGVTTAGQYPGGLQYPSSGTGLVPGQGSSTGAVSGVAGTSITVGQYPGGQQYPGGGARLIPGQASGTISGAIGTGIEAGQYPSGGVATVPGQTSATGVGNGVGGGEITATSQQSGGPPGGDDGADSQALSSVKQGEGGTQASASAEGRHGTGSATSQVSGTYTGTGSFSAQAGTSDNNKSAQTQVSGGKEGARSSAQGSGGLGRSQVQVELDSDTGATSTSAQSGGWQHGTSSKVEASGQGGLADAQANGEGQTSSQAQIGFQPYRSRGDEKPNTDRRDKPFRGGGTASAQSGTYRGQSQTQLQGSFHYGITYTGASQASSGSGAAALRKPFNFTTPDEFKPFKLDDHSEASKKANKAKSVPKEQLRDSSSRRQRLPAPPTRQEVRVVTDGDHEVSVKQRDFPATRKPPASETRSLEHVGGIVKPPGSEYVSVTNSVAGKIDSEGREKDQADEEAGTKKYEHRYFTKSSTCGYFTFSCNVVYGSNGRRKICKPKLPDASSKC
ncbi:hypothetical protein QAD02_008926 [Eretmocerus hayati]|uniref:Uncharacterized protein n=1 Tax=Eretmocerus hayati TaxID=131215 RepID=A0ACC2NAB0_9HYME|nr:hypothetical protein QAD02_008926 [Eretmocerus hayati]